MAEVLPRAADTAPLKADCPVLSAPAVKTAAESELNSGRIDAAPVEHHEELERRAASNSDAPLASDERPPMLHAHLLFVLGSAARSFHFAAASAGVPVGERC